MLRACTRKEIERSRRFCLEGKINENWFRTDWGKREGRQTVQPNGYWCYLLRGAHTGDGPGEEWVSTGCESVVTCGFWGAFEMSKER